MEDSRITLIDLISRPIIRDDQPFEFMNKMTDDEIECWELEVEGVLETEGADKSYPTWNASLLAKTIDRDILYNSMKISCTIK